MGANRIGMESISQADALNRLNERLERLGGCGDGDCKVHRRPGMHTNGGCRCLRDPMTAERVVMYYRQFVKDIEA